MNAIDYHALALHTIQSWCSSISSSVQQKNLEVHMSLVSQKVSVYGMPSKGVIDYTQWQTRRQHEFENGELLSLNYQAIRIINSTAKRIVFNTNEVMMSQSGTMVTLDKNITLEYESDEVWRVVEENVKQWQVKKIDLKKY